MLFVRWKGTFRSKKATKSICLCHTGRSKSLNLVTHAPEAAVKRWKRGVGRFWEPSVCCISIPFVSIGFQSRLGSYSRREILSASLGL